MEILKLYFLGELPNFKKLGQLCETRQCYNRSNSAVIIIITVLHVFD